MLNLDLPYPYLCAIARRVNKGFDALGLPAQQDAAAAVKAVALQVAVGEMPRASYSDTELLIANALTELPVDAWEASLQKAPEPVAVPVKVVTEAKAPTKKEKK